MAKRLEIKGNYLILTDTISGIVEHRLPSDRITYDIYNDTLHIYYINRYDQNYNVLFADLVDSNNTPFASESALDDFLSLNTGGVISTAGTTDFMLEVAKGAIADTRPVHKFGANLDVASGVQEDVNDMGGTYTYPTVSADMTHLSQDIDQPTFRGKTVQVDGLDINWDRIIQMIIMDAANTSTPVVLPTPLFRINTMQVQAELKATSNVRLHNVGDTITYSQITPVNNQTLQSNYSVERGSSAYMTNVYGDVIESTGKEPKSVEFNLWVANRKEDWDFQLKSARGVPKAGPAATHSFRPYLGITEMSDIKITAQPSDQPAHVHAGFDLIIEKN